MITRLARDTFLPVVLETETRIGPIAAILFNIQFPRLSIPSIAQSAPPAFPYPAILVFFFLVFFHPFSRAT